MFGRAVAAVATLALVLCWLTSSVSSSPSPIKNVVVVMFENRAFDHMLGHLKAKNPNIDGLTGKEFNYVNPSDPSSTKVSVSFDAPDDMNFNPGHAVSDTLFEVYGQNNANGKPNMSGFLQRGLERANGDLATGRLVMQCFNESSLSVLSTLASEFALFDGWFCSVPGPTGPNRLYSLAATSYGEAVNTISEEIKGFPEYLINFALGLDWSIFYGDIPTSLQFRYVRDFPLRVREYSEFKVQAKSGTLPTFSYIEPRWFSLLDYKENIQHPEITSRFLTGSVLNGEMLLKDIYETLVAFAPSPQWNSTMLLVYYDEHGGLYDHVPPPANVPNPDGRISQDPPFAFDRAGVRVPAVVISPWIKKATVIHSPTADGKYFEHSSLLATMRKLFDLNPKPLSKRESWAASFEDLFSTDKPRTDFLKELPLSSMRHIKSWSELSKSTRAPLDLTRAAEEQREEIIAERERSVPMSDFHVEFVRFSDDLPVNIPWEDTEFDLLAHEVKTVAEAAWFVRRRVTAFTGHLTSKNL